MSGTQPVMVYGLKVPPGDILVPGAQDMPIMYHVTMAAIDPTEEPALDAEANGVKPARSTLKIIRMGSVEDQFPSEDEDEDEDEDKDLILDEGDEDEDEESSDEKEANGGPSDPEKVKKAREAAALKSSSSSDDESDEEDGPIDIEAALKRIAKGKAVATDESSEEEDVEMEEYVICTLDPEKQYQQPLDIVCNENERVFFKVSGPQTVYLTGNYVIPIKSDDDQSYDPEGLEDEYDLSPDEDELDLLNGADDESDELDSMGDPRITELESDDMDEAPKLIEKPKAKGKNKRSLESSSPIESEDESATLDAIIAKSVKLVEPLTNGDAKLSKKQRKKLKKLNTGEAVAVDAVEEKKDASSSLAKPDKKVQFADKLEQGPTNSKKDKSDDKKNDKAKSVDSPKAKPSVKVVQGVTVDDRKIGEGAAAKKGDRIEMRYIGKLDADHGGKVFDSNKKGKPFTFRLGAGEVIKGWDIGIAGMAIGGERRLTIPANMGYGTKGTQGIPGNATLVFDVKLLNIK